MDDQVDRFREATRIGGLSLMEATRPQPAEAAFSLAWARLLPLLTATEPCDYAVAAVSPTGDVRVEALAASVDQPCHFVAGRHDLCDLHLTDDPKISLRHALLRVALGSTGAPSCRVLDLASSAGLRDEFGQQVGGLTSDGDLFVQICSWWILAFRVHPERRWAQGAAAAWEALPPRTYLNDEPPHSSPVVAPRRRRRLELVAAHREVTQIRVLESTTQLALVDRHVSDAIGALVVRGDGNRAMIHVSPRQLATGVLIGRYPRCALSGQELDETDRVSRVHLCLLLIDGELWAIDTRSTNGTTCDDEPIVGGVRLGSQALLELGDALSLSWKLA